MNIREYKLNTSLNSQTFWAYLQLMRPANIVTAWADILAGYAASGLFLSDYGWHTTEIVWLLLSTTGLYGGGIVFNDVFDSAIDAQERPERPIPSGRASRLGAIWLGSLLLLMGVIAASQVTLLSFTLAAIVALAAIIYDALGKHHPWLGPINMGCCRGGNLLLGVSAVPTMVAQQWFLALIPIAYIAAITAISQGEVHGGKKTIGAIAIGLIVVVISGLLVLGLLPNYQVLITLPFVGLLAGRVLPPFVKAAGQPQPDLIKSAVKAGVLSLIVLDATMAAGFAGWVYGLLVLLLLPISARLAQLFAVT
ncbi:UbiA-like protein EboC [Anabaena azotica]|uniref:UbiA-like protein EboC n=1 Tax=Anabaena azotica FACHB-119 TaxID=947527 RepID=A0ABR8D5W9_9NOST|nr:UbiA-like protein EboC [Anabaena azotica]MBD2502099.1 UbiA-like protein EboC [Anabaena azotica FACHB-119]